MAKRVKVCLPNGDEFKRVKRREAKKLVSEGKAIVIDDSENPRQKPFSY